MFGFKFSKHGEFCINWCCRGGHGQVGLGTASVVAFITAYGAETEYAPTHLAPRGKSMVVLNHD